MQEEKKGVLTSLPATAESTSSVDGRMARGAVWMVSARVVDRLIGLLSIVILARLLVPADFGLVAMASAIVAMVELFGALGLDTALIQNQTADRRHFDTAWTFHVLLGAAIALALLAIASPAAHFFAEPRLAPVIACLALAALLQGFENIGIVQFRRQLRFNKEFNLILAKRIAVFVVTIPLAFALRSYWALVTGIIVGRVAALLITYQMHEYRPRFSLVARKELFGFGKWLVASNLLQFLGTRSADLLVGKISGARELGIFNLSHEISNLPTGELVAPINRAVYPGYAQKAAANLETLRKSYLQIIGLVAALVIPAGVGIAAIAELMVPVVLGKNWLDAIPVIFVLSFNGILLALKSNNHYVYLALGKPQLAVFLGTVQVALLIPLIALGSAHSGAFGVAVGFLLAQIIFTPVSVAVLRRTLQLRIKDLAAVLYRPVLASMVMFAGVRLLASSLSSNLLTGPSLAFPLLACIAAGIGLYSVAGYALWIAASRPMGPELQLFDLIAQRIGARSRRMTAPGP